MDPEQLNNLCYDIIGAAYEVRRNSSRYLLESFYERALEYELKLRGYKVERQIEVPVIYKGVTLDHSLRLDMLIEDDVIIELKAVSNLSPEAFKQLSTYLELTGRKIGFVMNFAAKDFVSSKVTLAGPYDKGIYRIIR